MTEGGGGVNFGSKLRDVVYECPLTITICLIPKFYEINPNGQVNTRISPEDTSQFLGPGGGPSCRKKCHQFLQCFILVFHTLESMNLNNSKLTLCSV